MLLTFENGWEGVWLAYGTAGVLLLDAVVCIGLATIVFCILCECTQRLGLHSIHKYLRILTVNFLAEIVLKSLIIVELMMVIMCCIGFVMKE